MKEEQVELTEIWVPCKPEDATAFVGKVPVKLVAKLIKGHPIWLAKDVVAEKHWLTETEAKRLV